MANTSTILQTKLFIPQPDKAQVNRRTLLSRLNAGISQQKKLFLIAAPAGYGKTSLISAWLKQSLPAAWLSLDALDNDPARFLLYFCAALENLNIPARTALETLLQAGMPQVETAATLIINQISQHTGSIIFVLDDYHLIVSDWIHRWVDFLLQYCPANFHLVITTREIPPLALPRMRVQRDVEEISADDLRFSTVEAAQFLQNFYQLDLSHQDVEHLSRETEGWAAGLQLFALSLHNSNPADYAKKIQSLSGEHHLVADYLMDEVLKSCPLDVQEFLLNSSIFDRFSIALYQVVFPLQAHHAADLLAYLKTHQLFVIPLDDRHEWFRYHHLFSDFLRMRFPTQNKAAIHQSAARWFAAHGQTEEAIDHAQRAQDYPLMASLLEKAGSEMVKAGELLTIKHWLGLLPEETRLNSIDLCVYQGWASMLLADWDDFNHIVNLAYQRLNADAPDALRGQIIALKACLVQREGNVEEAMELALQAVSLIDDRYPLFQSTAHLTLAGVQMELGFVQESTNTFKHALKLCLQVGNLLAGISALYSLTALLLAQGKPSEARHICEATLSQAKAQGYADASTLVRAIHGCLAHVFLARNQLDQALALVQDALQTTLETGVKELYAINKLLQARILHQQGDTKQAAAIMAEISRFGNQDSSLALLGLAYMLLFALQQESPSVPPHQAETLARVYAIFPIIYDDTPFLVHCRCLMHMQKPDEAIRLLQQRLANARQMKLHAQVIHTEILLAKVCLQKNRNTEAEEYLAEALLLAAPENLLQPFLIEHTWIEPLLIKLKNKQPQFIQMLLSGLPQAATRINMMVNALTERECEVLREAATGASNRQIAANIFVTEDTVKKHLQHIFQKLGVDNRTQAINKAKALGILS